MQTDRCIWVNVFDERTEDIIRIELDEVLKRIVAYELPDSFEIEAVKALAAAVRTVIVKRLRAFDGVGCEKSMEADICTSMKGCSCVTSIDMLKEVLKERFDSQFKLSCTAVDETSGYIITCGSRPISADYHLTCGGGTENSEDVLGNRIMYSRKVLCNYCAESPYWENTVDIPVKELEDKLKVKIIKGNGVYGPEIEGIIDNIERDDTGRVRRVRIGGRSFTGIEVKELLGLNSSRFGWDPIVFRFKVRGAGSGLGMCLYGANTLAMQGKNYIDILKYYYTNINIEKIDMVGETEPLKGKVFVIDPGHGGPDEEGEVGPAGLKEKDVNLYIAMKLGDYLEKSGAKVVYTRVDDTSVSLAARVEMANSIRPNFMISIHQNAFFSSGMSGTEVYFYRGDIEGSKMSKKILDNIVRSLFTVNRGSKYADLYLLRESKVSSVMVECMYISNPGEEQRLLKDQVKDEIAKAIYRGVMDYYGM